ncbi:MAG TPA: PilZ domain-containing protein [Pyrinomonadaceae bacterium]|nr:PilZ domain-containing protein [Pyrinomonadaceae bacterium]
MYKLIVSCYYWPAGARGLRLRTLTLKQNVNETGLTPSRPGRLTSLDTLAAIERRNARRLRVKCEVELAATLSLLDNDAYDEESKLIFFGQTSDLSAEGLAMVLPATIIDERFCSGSNKLKLSLHLPDGIVGLEVSPVRCERLTDAYSVHGYLLGTKITNVENRGSFERYLDGVSGQSMMF